MMKKAGRAGFARKAAAGILAAATLISGIPSGGAMTAYADDDPNTGNPVAMVGAEESSHYDGEMNYLTDEEYDEFGLALNAPDEFDPEDGENPMDVDEGETRIMQTLNELFIARGNYDDHHFAANFSVLEDVPDAEKSKLTLGSMLDNKFGGKDTGYSAGYDLRYLGVGNAQIQTANATALDMDGDGTDEVAMTFLLLDASTNMSYRLLRIYDYKDDGTPEIIGENLFHLADESAGNKMFVKSIELESSHGLASITAGDYDRDGFDEVAVYNPQCGTWRSHVEIYDVSAAGLTRIQRITLPSIVTDNRFYCNYDYHWYVPMCSLATTSISGEDDLVINAINPYYWEHGYGVFGHTEAFAIFRYSSEKETMQQVVRSDLSYGDCQLLFTSATDGDLNGNGVEELLVGGNWDVPNVGVDRNHNGLMVYCWNTEKGGYEAVWSKPKKLEANSNIRAGQEMQAPMAIAAAQLVTYSSKDTLFLGGVLFSADGAKAEEDAQEKDNLAPVSFTKIDRYGLAGTNHGAFILDVAVGHFVKNSINEEQICVITGDYQQGNTDHVSLDYGFVFREVQDAEKSASFDPTSSLDANNLKGMGLACVVTSNDFYSRVNEDEDGTYVCICPLNVDHDTYEYTYIGKECGWSSPTLYSVVNAVPYWKELSYANGVPGTESWSVKVSDAITDSGSAGVGLGLYWGGTIAVTVGVRGNTGSLALTARMDAGLNWLGTWGKTRAVTETLTLTLAPNKNYAIVYAMPVVNYRYMMHSPEYEVTQAIYDAAIEEDPSWPYKVGDIVPAGDEEVSVTEQLTPSFSAIPVGTYNALARQYDLQEILYGTNENDGDRYIPARTIGDPTTYPATNQVFADPEAVKNGKFAAGVSTNQAATISHDETDTYTETHNFTARFSSTLGLTAKVTHKVSFVSVGFDLNIGASLNLSGGWTHTTANTRGVTYSANFSRLPDGCQDYGYTVMLAMYDLPGSEKVDDGSSGDDFTPNGRPFVLDYVVTDFVSRPPEVSLNLRALASTSDSVLLKWDNPKTGERYADHYDVYVMSGDNPVKIGTVPSSTDTFVATDLVPGRKYEFKLRAAGNKYNGLKDSPVSVYSSAAAAYTLSDSVQFTKQPQSGYIPADTAAPDGGSYTLEAAAEAVNSERGVAYQWQRAVPNAAGTETFVNIEGATGTAYTVTAEELGALGGKADYRVWAYLSGGDYAGAYSHIAGVVLEQDGIAYHDTETAITLAETEEENVYNIHAAVTTAGENPETVKTGSVVFYSTPIGTDRDLYGAENRAADATILGTVQLSDDGTADLANVTATEEGIIVGARYLAGGAGSNYYYGSISNEISLRADYYVKLTYELNGGTNAAENPDPIILTEESETITLADPAREGYTFAGWMLNGSVVTEIDPEKVTEDGVIYAAWTANTYAIDYELDGGSFKGRLGGIPHFTSGMNVPLRRAVRDGYTFAGWYLDEEIGRAHV